MTGKDTVARAHTSENSIAKFISANLTEETIQESAFNADSQMKPFNTDDLYVKTGDYSIYEEMLKDDQVSIALQLKKDLVLASGFDIIIENDEDEEIKLDIEKAIIEDPDIALEDMLEEIISAYEYGFSLSEKTFKKRPDGRLSLKTIKTRHPDTWLIHTDEQGNVEKYEQMGITKTLTIDPNNLIHYVNNRKFQNPYGTSDLRAAYDAYFIKKQIIKFYGIFLEKAASPTPVAKYDKNAPQKAIDDIFAAIKKFQTKTALVIPKEMEVSFLESSSTGEAYIKGINIFNMFIGRSLFIPDLLGFQGKETTGGSQALGREQLDVLFKHISRRRKTLERLVNKEIIKPIIDFNFGDIEHPPKFKLRPISEQNALELVKVWSDTVKGRVYKPSDEEINHFRKIVNFPQGDVEQDAPAPDPTNPEIEKVVPKLPVNPDEIDKDKEGEDEGKSTFARVFKNPDGDFHKRVDFAAMGAQLDRAKNITMAEAKPIIAEIFEDLFDQIEKKKIIQNQRVDRIDTIKLKKLKSLKQVLKKNLRDTFAESKKMARQELLKSNFAEPLPSDAFLKVLDEETFQYIGDWEYAVTKNARIEMISAIKDGRPLSSVINILNESGKKDSLVSVERYARTKHTEVMNRGRLEFFNESGIVSGYQYSAILDDRTTAICSGLHGKKFKAGDEPIPPMHFSCRSTLIPITIFEEFKEDKKVGKRSINDFIDEEKGKGFAKR